MSKRFSDLHIGSSSRGERLHPYRGNRAEQSRPSVESDGTSTYTLKDPPGQNCSYIPPGDHRDEFYRLGTYGRYPSNTPIQLPDMAASGFYYTGFKDRVKCFSCGVTVENWAIGDVEIDPKWHKTVCNMANGNDLQNIALPKPNYRTILRDMKALQHTVDTKVSTTSHHQGLSGVRSNFDRIQLREDADSYPKLTLANVVDPEYKRKLKSMNLRNEYDRRKTYEKFPTYPAPHLVGDLAKDGLFYLGNLDRTQCFSCSGVLRNWGPNDSVREQHDKHFAHCRMIRGLDCGNIPMSDADRSQANTELADKLSRLASTDVEPPDPTPDEQRHLAVYLPCSQPVNRHMQSLQRRIETFNNSWPKSRIRAPIEQIAKAGFFYLGEGDKTKCFYCNGGLQNWDRNDEPWTEHAKWFPRCEYILRQKGVRFVQTMVENHPNLNRPLIRNPVLYENIPPFQSDNGTPTANNPIENVDMTRIRSMGFNEEKIKRALSRATTRGVQPYTEELIQYLLEDGGPDLPVPQENSTKELVAMQGSSGLSDEEETATIKQPNVSSPPSLEQGKSIAESVRKLTETTLCRQCKANKADIVYTPCGHLAMCESCSEGQTKCVICRCRIQGKVKVYRA